MKRINELGKVLFPLGLMTSLAGLAVLMYLYFGQAVVPDRELARLASVVGIGLVMIAVSIATDLKYLRTGVEGMTGEWCILQAVGRDKAEYRVCRIKDVGKPGVLENIEYSGGLFSDETAAQEYADKLNREG